MKAVVMPAPGGPEVLLYEDIQEPELESPSQVKVQIRAAGVNPVDTKIRSRGVFMADGLQAVLGCDAAGVVVEAGEAVQHLEVGDEVWFCNGGLGGSHGNYAEFAVLDACLVRKKPTTFNFEQAGAAPLVLITAWEALFDRGRLAEGQTVLIHAGAGGVGHVAIQLAKSVGARVLTTVSSVEKADFVKSLGVDEAILYTQEDFVEAVDRLTKGRGADLVLDTVGPDVFAKSIPTVAHYGDLVTLLDPGGEQVWKEARNRNIRVGFTLMLTPMLRDLPEARDHHGEILEQCAELADSGKLDLRVNRVMPLGEAAEAHRLVEAGHTRGKIVLIP
ncbi:zinc-dependent alcohol dehydrogenase family protein [endosymbiont of Ridgeia piscesae]|jgi:NADPH2:quinone reductase|uniref:NADPH2:quinone reductase n=1 Tax=endosymbiont of Ridgeia piscesae TaxID=54398 RepID=A0A0T5ZAY1_9GAMM|nr:zinc-dependent alcohol dehydrogenase family protein [endosymbiont of Ridgeia piscesae]KRT53673.1 NADPH:quinone reductase or related Zn-dependent oxidoreductase [endosymbiont of Ridgeia piscesae]KRT59951.1 NADPH2:quinone reductase [endosymbiont of Ridgeia piscesae]